MKLSPSIRQNHPWSMVLLGLVCATAPAYSAASPSAPPDAVATGTSQGPTALPAVVGALGLPQAIDFEGNKSFSTRALREGLAGWPDFLLAAHPAAPLSEYLQEIQRALARGYRDAGFPKTQVELATDVQRQRVLVKVTEGPRFNRGEVRVIGAQEVSATDLIRGLTEPPAKAPDRLARAVETILEQQREPKLRAAAEATANQLNQKLPTAQVGGPPIDSGRVWMPNFQEADEIIWEQGKPVSFNESFLQRAVQEVRRHLAERGHPLAEVSATLATDASTHLAHLLVKVAAEGPRAVVGNITVTGQQRNSREEILDAIGLKPGMPATPEVLMRAKLALWNSARFYSFDLTPAPRPAPAREVDIAIELDENEKMPPLREPLTRYQTALVRFANWMTIQTGRQELGFVATVGDQAPLKVVFFPGSGLILLSKSSGGDELGFSLGPGGGRAYAATPGRSARREFGAINSNWKVWVHFVTKADPTASGRRSNLQFGAGFGTVSNGSKLKHDRLVDLDLILSPAFACLNLAKDIDPQFENGNVVIMSPTGQAMLRFRETTGELLEWNLAEFGEKKNPGERPAVSAIIRSGRGEFEQIRKSFESAWASPPAPQASPESFAELLLAQSWLRSLARLSVSQAPGETFPSTRLSLMARLAERVIDLPEVHSWFAGDPAPRDPSFTISPDPRNTTEPSLLVNLLGAKYYQAAVMLWPADTWPAKLTRELFYILTGNTKYTGVVMEDLYQDPRMGPLGSVLTAQFLRKYNAPQAWRFARRALEHGSPEDFRNDWRLIFDSQTPVSGVARDLLNFLAELTDDELKALTATLPDADGALLQRAVTQLHQRRDQPPEEVLQPFLDEWWAKNMQPDLENRVGAMMAPGPDDPAINAATVNGLPVSRKLVNRLAGNPQETAWMPQRERRAGTPFVSAREKALADMVKLMLVQADFAGQGGTIKEEFLDQLILQVVQGQYGGNRSAFESALASQGLTPADNRELLRQVQIFGYMTSQEARKQPPPSDDEISRAIAALPPDQDSRHLRAIGVPKVPANPEEGRTRAEAIRAQVLADGTFEKVWIPSDTPESRALRRIKLPKVRRTDLRKEVADAAFLLEPDGISPVIESGDAFLVIHRDNVSPVGTADLRRQVGTQLVQQKQREAVLAYLDRLRASSIVRTLTDPALTATNIVAGKAGVIRLELESLPVASSHGATLTSPTTTLDSLRWSQGQQALCGSQADGWFEWEFTIPSDGHYQLDLFATRARDFGEVQIAIDGKNLGQPVELYAPSLQPSGALRLGGLYLRQGAHRFRCTIVGKHPSGTSYRFGLDAIDLTPRYGDSTQLARQH